MTQPRASVKKPSVPWPVINFETAAVVKLSMKRTASVPCAKIVDRQPRSAQATDCLKASYPNGIDSGRELDGVMSFSGVRAVKRPRACLYLAR